MASKNKPEIALNPKINEKKLVKTNSTEYLGIVIDEKLTWHRYIKKIKEKLATVIGALRQYNYLLPLIAKTDTHMLNHVTYCITA